MSLRVEMEGEEIEAVLERAWDLHDKISDAIHTLSKSHFINSIRKSNSSPNPSSFSPQDRWVKNEPGIEKNGLGSFTPHHRQPIHNGTPITAECGNYMPEEDRFAETRSLNAIRNALEVLEDQLQFLHTLQLQQRAERDSSLIHLEESRLMLLRRLKEHRGTQWNVIQEAFAFATDRDEADDLHLTPCIYEKPFATQANNAVYNDRKEKMDENNEDMQNTRQNGLTRFFSFGIQFVKNSNRFHKMAGVVAKVALVAVSMLAILRMQQTAQTAMKKDGKLESSKVQKNKGHSKKSTTIDDYFPKHRVGERTALPRHPVRGRIPIADTVFCTTNSHLADGKELLLRIPLNTCLGGDRQECLWQGDELAPSLQFGEEEKNASCCGHVHCQAFDQPLIMMIMGFNTSL
eukprot:Gb_29928 [translate_table: standard]